MSTGDSAVAVLCVDIHLDLCSPSTTNQSVSPGSCLKSRLSKRLGAGVGKVGRCFQFADDQHKCRQG